MIWRAILASFWMLLLSPMVVAEPTLRIAVAANFASTLEAVAAEFRLQTGYSVELAVGSTGKLYAQILRGAPLDLFFAADVERVASLQEQGIGVAGSRKTYALGQLVLLSRNSDPFTLQRLSTADFSRLATANPNLAPYGRAAQQTLEALGVELRPGQLVKGENVAQAFHFFNSGNAELAIVALSQVLTLVRRQDSGDSMHWLKIPAKYHQPIEQQRLQLQDSPQACEFLRFFESETAESIVRDHGYELPMTSPPKVAEQGCGHG